MSVNGGKHRFKRVWKENDERSEYDEEGHEQDQREIPEKYIVIMRFYEKAKENMKKINPFPLTTTLANKIGEIQYAKVRSDGNLLERCANDEQLKKALKTNEMLSLSEVCVHG